MKISAISDMHGNRIPIQECDVLCICGDIIPLNIQDNMEKSKYWIENSFLDWIKEIPCKKVIAIPGNHDIYFYIKYVNNWKETVDNLNVLSNGKLQLLCDESYEYNNTKFYGCPWISPIVFQPNRWAFEEENMNTPELSHYAKIPTDCDILLTHDSPYHNEVLEIYSKDCNCHLFGHWHEGEYNADKRKYNCSILDDTYSLKKRPILIKLEENILMDKYNIIIDNDTKKVIFDFLNICEENSYKNTIDLNKDYIKGMKDTFRSIWKQLDMMTESKTDIEDSIVWDTNINEEELKEAA